MSLRRLTYSSSGRTGLRPVLIAVALLTVLVSSVVADSEALQRILIDVPSQQVVGQPLRGPVSLILIDSEGGLVTDYDLAADPITVTSLTGELSNNLLDNPDWFSGGVIDFTDAGIVYTGNTGPVDLIASNSTVTSQTLRVSFSGYQIRHAEYPSGDSIGAVHTDLPTLITVQLVNGGDMTGVPDPSVKAFFRSGGGSLKAFYHGRSQGVPDTMNLELPTEGLALGEDTLVLVSEALFSIADELVSFTDTAALPVVIRPTMAVEVVQGSLAPDSVYAGTEFDVSLDVAAEGITPPIDSTRLSISLLDEFGDPAAVILNDLVSASLFDTDLLHYEGLEGLVDASLELPSGWYDLDVEYTTYLGGQMVHFGSTAQDSMLILPAVTLEYVSGSLSPTLIAGGIENGFEFDLTLSGADPLLLDSASSFFILRGEDFVSGVGFSLPDDTLHPGVNTVETGQIYVPAALAGSQIEPELFLDFYHPGAANRLSMTSDFEGASIAVGSVALIQIVEVKVVAPNGPTVNTGQDFQISCVLANLAETPMSPFDIQLTSNGSSEFEPVLTVPGIAGYSQVEVFFDLTADDEPNESELFRVDIASLGVTQQPPIDNIAILTIQRPANLFVTSLLVGADSNYVDIGESFDLILGIGNSGQASATNGRFKISTNGIYLGLPDGAMEVETVIPVGDVRGIQFVAPEFDTLINITVELIERPYDINYGVPAPISDTLIEIELAVTSLDISLEVGAADSVTNVVWPGGLSELIRLKLKNSGVSSVTSVRLESIVFKFTNSDGTPGDVWSLIEVGSTALYEGENKVTTATAGGNRLKLTFADFIVGPGEETELALRSRVKAEAGSEFGISLVTGDVTAGFAAGPLMGRTVPVVSTEGGDVIIEEPFVSFDPNLSGSFMMRNNPFNPREEEAEFRYFLDRSEDVTFRVLTLTGELVLERFFPEGSNGAREGENVVFWDGRNEGGREVLNGVYMVVLTTEITGRQVTLKAAVLK